MTRQERENESLWQVEGSQLLGKCVITAGQRCDNAVDAFREQRL